MTSLLTHLKVFATHPHPCSYLDDQRATTLFIDPEATIDPATYSELAELGFRRSGPHIYRPQCENCNACIPARIPVENFKPKRSQRKIWNRNQDLLVESTDQINNEEYFQLYQSYINARHADGDMYPPSKEQYASFLTDDLGVTMFYGFRLNGKLVAVAVIDEMNNGLSAIYTFFDPIEDRRSLGSYVILWQIELAKKLHLPNVYLGYWIKECQKMSYKIDYRPLELYINGRWLSLI